MFENLKQWCFRIARLLKWISNLQRQLHDPPTMSSDKPTGSNLDFVVTIGAQDGLAKVFSAVTLNKMCFFFNPRLFSLQTLEMLIREGDNVLIDCPTYSGTLGIVGRSSRRSV